MVNLAIKYRPVTFDKVIGQEVTVKILKNMVKTKDICLSYVFSGSFGTGKTTLARIFSRAINCENKEFGYNPCNKCHTCKSISSDTAMDVVEMDAASNGLVNDIRNLSEAAKYKPIINYKVFILDEAHSISNTAFQVFLKMLEVQGKAVFIFCTTRKDKIPETILSRSSVHDFYPVSDVDIFSLLKDIAGKENLKYDEKALKIISKLSDGSVRNALTVLSDLSTIEISVANTVKLYGLVTNKYSDSIFEYLFSGSVNNALRLTVNEINKGSDIKNMIKSLSNTLLDIVSAKYKCYQRINGSLERKKRISKLALKLKNGIPSKLFTEFCNADFNLRSLIPSNITMLLLISSMAEVIGVEQRNILDVSDIERLINE